jgi:DMSO/TMAO reductase YedYZ molybdopterin-dependent catalytic subunit
LRNASGAERGGREYRAGVDAEMAKRDPDAGISVDELQLATRNTGMPLEALDWPLTPAGLHYLLIHYDIPRVDASSWSLRVGGRVGRSLTLSLDELRSRPARTLAVTMECAGNGRARLEPRPVSQPWLVEAVGTAEWTGTPLRPLLEEAELLDDAVEVVFTGLDHGMEGGIEQDYERSLSIADASGDDVLLAYEMNGEPLLPQHGFPLRLVVPGWYGMTNVKWLARITAVAEPFAGFQQAEGYRMLRDRDDPGTPVTRMAPRALMVPPGFPDFMTRRRFVGVGPCEIRGRAWSGNAPVERVQVSADLGTTWNDATLDDDDLGPYAWRAWSWTWQPPAAGEYELWCRARDAAGNEQPVTAGWNVKGYANNSVQRVPVTVTDGLVRPQGLEP